jgi:hypothetical protein
VWTIVIANIITVAVCLCFMSHLARITRIRGTLLTPFILTLVYVGAFAEKNVFEDLGIVLVFGALGWVMAALDWPRPPLLLGLVLGPLAENKLFLSTDNYGAAWLTRPGVLILFGLIAAGLLVPLWGARRRRRAAGEAPAPPPAPGAGGGLRLDGATAFSALLVATFAWGLWASRDFGPRAGLFPWVVGGPTLALAIVQLARDLTGRRSAGRIDLVPAAELPRPVVVRRTAAICAWIAGFYAAIWLLGFSLATLLTTFLYLRLGARERWPIGVGLSLAAFAFVYGLFEWGLRVPFPPGRLFDWLGYAS